MLFELCYVASVALAHDGVTGNAGKSRHMSQSHSGALSCAMALQGSGPPSSAGHGAACSIMPWRHCCMRCACKQSKLSRPRCEAPCFGHQRMPGIPSPIAHACSRDLIMAHCSAAVLPSLCVFLGHAAGGSAERKALHAWNVHRKLLTAPRRCKMLDMSAGDRRQHHQARASAAEHTGDAKGGYREAACER